MSVWGEVAVNALATMYGALCGSGSALKVPMVNELFGGVYAVGGSAVSLLKKSGKNDG